MVERVPLEMDELRAVAGYAAQCARTVLEIFEALHPDDVRPRAAIVAAEAFAAGGARGKELRDAAWAALKAANEAGFPAATEAARAAMAAAGAAYLHPLARSTQVRHILGAAAHAAAAMARDAGPDATAADRHLALMARMATPAVRTVLARYPNAPGGGGSVGAQLRELDRILRG